MFNPHQIGKRDNGKPELRSSVSFRHRALIVIVGTIGVCIALGLYGLSLSNHLLEIESQLTTYDKKNSLKIHSLGSIKNHFGYGGFIHNFKNYVLRKDASLVPRIENYLRDTYKAIDSYPSDDQQIKTTEAIAAVRGVVDRYAVKFLLAQKLVAEGKSSVFIDKQVRVDDRPATQAFQFLNQYLQQNSHEQVVKTNLAVDKTLKLLGWGVLLIPGVILVGGIIVFFIRYNLLTNQNLKSASRYLSDLFEAAPDAMLIVDKTGSITDANKRATELFGYNQRQFRALRVEDLIPKRFRKQHVKIREGSFKKPERRDLDSQTEFNALTKDGIEVPVEISLNYTIKDGETHAITTLRDITERKQTESTLRHHQNMLSKAQKIAHVGSWEWHITNNKLTWSEEIYQIFGQSSEEFGVTYDAFVQHIHPEDREAVVNAVNEAVVYDKPYSLDHRIVKPDGEVRFVQERGDVFRDDAGEAQYMVGTMLDITELKYAENELRLADNVFNHTSEAIMVTDAHNRILRVNQAFSIITGYGAEDAIGKTPNELLRSGKQDLEFYAYMWFFILGRGFWEGELWDKRKDGTIFPSWHNISAIKDEAGNIIQFTSIFGDITDKKIAEEHIQHLAQFDQLTQLPNRALFNDRLQHALSRSNRSSSNVGLMFIDLDRFKNVNDSLGHHAGDQLLQEVSKRLVACVREQDTVARLGGDEFTIILEELRNAEDAAIIANKVIETLSHTVSLGEHEVTIGGSIGISIYPDDGADTESIVKNADMAMYQAKNQGKNCYRFYTEELANVADTRFETENRLRQALIREEFEVYYQPQVNWLEGKVVGAEALIRWNDPDKGLIVPAEFITLAEEMGLIDSIGEWVLEAACKQTKTWQEQGLPEIRMSVNVSGYQFMHGDIVASVKQVLKSTQLDSRYLELEVTESFVMEHPERGAAILNELRDLGISIAIDDFGTGYSSLSYLKQLSVNRLKIDRSFVMDIPHDKDDEAIVATIIAMANNLGISVIAEGVENAAQVKFLSDQGCVDMQGYYFGKPVQHETFVNMFKLDNIN